MPKRSSKLNKRQAPADLNLLASGIVRQATGKPGTQPPPTPAKAEKPKDPLAVELRGGKARAQKLSPKKRSEIAKKAALKRWEKAKKPAKKILDSRLGIL